MSASRHTLLFVDDEVEVLEILRKTFEQRFRVLSASSPARALEVLKAEPVDLLITDQKMPGMSGIELVAQAREMGLEPTAILLTAHTDPTDLIAAINQGHIYRFVTKPWDLHDLSMTVKNAIEYTELKKDKAKLLRQLEKRVQALSILYEVSQQGIGEAPTYEAIVDRVLSAIARVLPYQVGAALVSPGGGRSSTLRLHLQGAVSDRGLLWVKDTVLASHRKASGQLLPEDQVVSRVVGPKSPDGAGPATFASQVTVWLMSRGRPVGTLSLFSSQPGLYSAEDVQLLDVLANQTTEAISSLQATEDVARRRIERMVESMADGVLLTDEKNEIVVVNPAARRLLQLGDDPGQLTARHLQEVLGFYPFELVRGWEYGGAQVMREELKIFERTIHSTVSPVADQHGTLRGVVVVLRDITEQKELEQRKEEFVSMVSHEMRTPLTSISGALDLVLNFLAGDINEKQQRYLSMAKDSTEKLNSVVDDLLDLSKFAKGRMRMAFELTSIDVLVRQAVEQYAAAMIDKQIRVEVQVPKLALRVLADGNRVTQVLNNLLTNAVKFTPEGGAISLSLRQSLAAPGFVCLSLWNSGDPIPPEDLDRIFERFEQARTERTRTVRGTGLGLAICRSIVEAHGGRIWAEPEGEGARFVVVLPVEPPQECLDAEGAEPPAAPAPPRRGTVLVIEDEREVAYVIKAALLARQYEVPIACSAEEGLARARLSHPDVIAFDLELPDIDGLRLSEIFRHDPDTHHAALLAISGADQRERSFRAGAGAYLGKPLATDKLIASVDALFRARSGRPHGRVLVVDDDEKIREICAEVLSSVGFLVTGAASVAEARRALRETRPDVLLLDVVLDDGDGFTFFEELKAERASSHLSVIFISARTETSSKVRALKLGGDDYLTKPFDALELGARVEAVMRRRDLELSASPTTQLPGSALIEKEVQRRFQEARSFAFCYLDLDNLKAYNDYYGFAKADGVVRQTADLMREVFAQSGQAGDFLGHVAGDDFVFICGMETVEAICQQAVEAFDRIIPLYYDKADRERGFIEAEDRFGERRRFPIMSVSIVAVICDGTSLDHAQLARLAADLKKRAKAIPGSVFLRSDRETPARFAAG